MGELITVFIIAIALSMDTFSLSLGIGTYNISKRKMFLFSSIVGIMHFLMPLLGNFVGNSIISFFTISSDFLLGIILIYLAIAMLIDLFKKEEKNLNFNFFNMLLFAFGVSIDSFSTGLGLQAITTNMIGSVIIFSITSFCFTYLGLLIGKYANKLLGTYACILGSLLLICIGIMHLCK